MDQGLYYLCDDDHGEGQINVDQIAGSMYHEINPTHKEMQDYESLLSLLKYLDARHFQSNLAIIMKAVEDPKCPRNIIFTICSWLFRKIYSAYKVKKPDRKKYTDILIPAIQEEFNIVVKGNYLHYNDTDIIKLLAEHFYFNRFQQEFFILQMVNDVQLINLGKTEDEMKEHFLGWIRKATTYEQQCNLLDILLKYFPQDPEVKDVREKMEHPDQKHIGTRNLYTNDQNAHDEDITTETLLALDKLMTWYKKNPFIHPDDFRLTGPSEYDMMYKQIHEIPHVENVLVRAKIDTTTFPTENHVPTIMDCLIALVRFIDGSPCREDLYKRLAEEVTSMDGLCTSGYINRFISVLQGFHEEYTVKIPFQKQLRAILTHNLSKHMKQATEDEIEGSYNPEFRRDYLNMVERVTNQIIPEIQKSHGKKDVDDNIVSVMTEITGALCNYQHDAIHLL